ncbi:hypothetical protein ACPV3A_29550 [Paenibacillus sp. Dod16]|uniref:hypothetical protein n=1 Tax=Paenibacillus sp. Dod16 TaxID=3416392 RepID=UPI003CF5566A
MKYRVIIDIQDGWEGSAKVGDILTLGKWEGDLTLYNGDKAVCDAGSPYALNHCEPVKEGITE